MGVWQSLAAPRGRGGFDAAARRHFAPAHLRAALLRLSPFFISVMPGRSDASDTAVWQPRVPQTWRGQDSSSAHDMDHADTFLFQVVPTYFVPATLVQEKMRAQCSASLLTFDLQWHQLANSPLAELLEWSDDHVLMRLRNTVRNPLCGVANDLYSLKENVGIFHQALNVLALLLPTVAVSPEKVRWMYKMQFLTPGGAFQEEIGHVFRSRFPDAMAFLNHPDLQFAMLRETGSDALRFHPSFQHVYRGVADKFYTTLWHPRKTESRSSFSEDESLPKCTRLMLPYIRSAETEAALSYISKEPIVGLYCTFSNDDQRIYLSVATAQGVVITCEGDSVSLAHLISSGVKDGGLPREVVDVLISPDVTKILLTESIGHEDSAVNEHRVVLLLKKYFNVEGKTICPLWKWALYVGFPLSLPVSPDISRFLILSIISRGDSASDNSFDKHPAWLTALCASRLLAFFNSNDYTHNSAALGQFLMATANTGDSSCCEEWMRRNVHIRIRRYGVKPNELATWRSCLLQLKRLSELYGPEVCIMRNEMHSSEKTSMEVVPSDVKESVSTEHLGERGNSSVNDSMGDDEYLAAVGATETAMPVATEFKASRGGTHNFHNAITKETAVSDVTSADVDDENDMLAALLGIRERPEDAGGKLEPHLSVPHSDCGDALSSANTHSDSVIDSDKETKDFKFCLEFPRTRLKDSQPFRRKSCAVSLPSSHIAHMQPGRFQGKEIVSSHGNKYSKEDHLNDFEISRMNQLASEILRKTSSSHNGSR